MVATSPVIGGVGSGRLATWGRATDVANGVIAESVAGADGFEVGPGVGVRGCGLGVADGTAGVELEVGRVSVGTEASSAARGAGSGRAGVAVAATGGRLALGTTTVTRPRMIASIVRSGVGWGSGVGNVWARALPPQPVIRISASTRSSPGNPT